MVVEPTLRDVPTVTTWTDTEEWKRFLGRRVAIDIGGREFVGEIIEIGPDALILESTGHRFSIRFGAIAVIVERNW